LPDPTVVHLHGAHTPPASDGFPTDYIMPGTYRDYFYPNDDERGGHVLVPRPRDGRHRAPRVRRPVRLLHPRRRVRGQPAAAQAAVRHPLCLQDRSFNNDGSLYYDSFDHNGFLGNHFLVNGAITPYLATYRRKYRFRLMNGSNARVYVLRLTNREKFTVIASDGGLLERPDVTDELIIAPAERYDIVIDFAQYPAGHPAGPDEPPRAVHRQGRRRRRPGLRPAGDGLRRGVQPRASAGRHQLRAGRAPPDPAAAGVRRDRVPHLRVRALQLDVDDQRPDLRPGAGRLPREAGQHRGLDADNGSGGWVHPIHIHDIQWQLLQRSGRTIYEHEKGWKDTFFLAGGETARVIGKFTGENNVGRYQFHCHNIEHEDMRMMSRWDVVR
jgi:spore coat protein A